MNDAEGRPAPVPLGAAGLFVPAECAGELAGALSLYRDLLLGRRPPAEVALPHFSRALVDMQAVAATVAREHQAARHRAAAQAASAARSIDSTPLVRPAVAAALSGSATVTVEQAAIRLQLSERRIQQLAAAGRISGVRSDRKVWLLSSEAVDAYRQRKRSAAHGQAERAAGTGQP